MSDNDFKPLPDQRSVDEALAYFDSDTPVSPTGGAGRGGCQVRPSERLRLADVENDTALLATHLFRIASHSKTFTATAVLQLVCRRRCSPATGSGCRRPTASPISSTAAPHASTFPDRLALQDFHGQPRCCEPRVEAGAPGWMTGPTRGVDYLTRTTPRRGPVTIRQLLSHSSGLSGTAATVISSLMDGDFLEPRTTGRPAGPARAADYGTDERLAVRTPNAPIRWPITRSSRHGPRGGSIPRRADASPAIFEPDIFDADHELDRGPTRPSARCNSSLAYGDVRVPIEHVGLAVVKVGERELVGHGGRGGPGFATTSSADTERLLTDA